MEKLTDTRKPRKRLRKNSMRQLLAEIDMGIDYFWKQKNRVIPQKSEYIFVKR